MQETLYQTADEEGSLSDIGCRRHSIRQPMQESLYQTADARVCQTADAGDTLSHTYAEVSRSDSRCRSLSIRHTMQETLYQTADADVSL